MYQGGYVNREKSKPIKIMGIGTDTNGIEFERIVVVESGGCVLVVAGEDALEGGRIFHVTFTSFCTVSIRRPAPITVVDTVNSNALPDCRLPTDKLVELWEDHRCQVSLFVFIICKQCSSRFRVAHLSTSSPMLSQSMTSEIEPDKSAPML